MRERPIRYINGLLTLLCALGFAHDSVAAPIKSIFVDRAGSRSAPDPLVYSFDEDTEQGTLTVNVGSFTVLVTRIVDGVDTPEYFNDASFQLTATGLSDASSQKFLAAGMFDSVNFQLRDSGGDVLLSGSQPFGADLLYSESLLPDIMFLNSGPVEVTGGSLQNDFDVQALVFGIGLGIDPSTSLFDALDVNHSGSIKLNLFPVPEPTSIALWALAFAPLWRRQRRKRFR